MARTKRWLAPWKDDEKRPVLYHIVSRIVDRRFVLKREEKEHFRRLMRQYERFSGCRVLSYCVMSNHFHILLEVPPLPPEGLADSEFFKRLAVFYPAPVLSEIRDRLEAARELADPCHAQEVMRPFLRRMHDLSNFMRGLLQRFTCWFNRVHSRTGTLWEQRFKSLIVEDGVASRTMAAYIDLNPVRAGMVKDPADYRWSSYGEAVGGGKKARAGLVRALHAHRSLKGTARGWANGVAKEYRFILLEGAEERLEKTVGKTKKLEARVVRKGMTKAEVARETKALEARKRDLAISKAVRCRLRHLTDGGVIGGKAFVNEVFVRCRERFSEKRETGARKPRGDLSALSGEIWSARDLQKT